MSNLPIRKRRSSILKSQKTQRTPLSEIEFKEATPTDNTKSRRVSFSRRTDVAEFATNEATTTWKLFYEERNKSLESSGNDSEVNQPCSVSNGGIRTLDYFQEVIADVDCVSTLGIPRTRIVDSSININFTQQLADLECVKDESKHSNVKYELSSFTERNSKIFNDENLLESSNDLNDISMVHSISNDFNTTQAQVRDSLESDMSITELVPSHEVQKIYKNSLSQEKVTSNQDLENVDWTADKENNPYVMPDKTYNICNEESDKVLVFDGKKLQYADVDVDLNKLDKTACHNKLDTINNKTINNRTDIFNKDLSMTEVISGIIKDTKSKSFSEQPQIRTNKSILKNDVEDFSISDELISCHVNQIPKFQGGRSMKFCNDAQILIQGENADSILNQIDTDSSKNKKSDVLYQPQDDTKISKEKSVIKNTKILNKDDELVMKNAQKRRTTILFENSTGDLSFTKAIPDNIIPTILDMSITQVKDQGNNIRKTVIFDNEMITCMSNNIPIEVLEQFTTTNEANVKFETQEKKNFPRNKLEASRKDNLVFSAKNKPNNENMLDMSDNCEIMNTAGKKPCEDPIIGSSVSGKNMTSFKSVLGNTDSFLEPFGQKLHSNSFSNEPETNVNNDADDANDTNELLEKLSSYSDCNDIESRKTESTDSNNEIENINTERRRQSMVVNREDMMHSMSMLRNLLQNPNIDDTLTFEDTETSEYEQSIDRVCQPRKPIRLSKDIVKSLNFDDDESINESKITPSKKRVFAETSYSKDIIRKTVIDMPEDVKELMKGLVKPNIDELPNEMGADENVKTNTSKCSMQVQKTVISSNQIDISMELQSRIPSTADVKFSDIEHKRNIMKHDNVKMDIQSIETSNKIVLFDLNNPLNNISFVPGSVIERDTKKHDEAKLSESESNKLSEPISNRNLVTLATKASSKQDHNISVETDMSDVKKSCKDAAAATMSDELEGNRKTLDMKFQDKNNPRKRSMSPPNCLLEIKTLKQLNEIQKISQFDLKCDLESGENVKKSNTKRASPKQASTANIMEVDSYKNCELYNTSVNVIDEDKIDSELQYDSFTDVSSKTYLEKKVSENVIPEIDSLPFMGTSDCEWEDALEDKWTFILMDKRLRLCIRLTHRHDNALRTQVWADTPIESMGLEKLQENKSHCVNFAEKAMSYCCKLYDKYKMAGDVPDLLRYCASISNVALSWGRNMYDMQYRLPYKLDCDRMLKLKVANIPLRSVWEIRMIINLGKCIAHNVPCPMAMDVQVERISADFDITEEEISILIKTINHDWGHVPNTIWKLYKYIENKTKHDDYLIPLLQD